MKQEKVNEMLKYENSFLWSPKFTPKDFRKFICFALFVGLLMLYIRYIATPMHMMKQKKRLGIRFPQLEKRGWLNGWYE